MRLFLTFPFESKGPSICKVTVTVEKSRCAHTRYIDFKSLRFLCAACYITIIMNIKLTAILLALLPFSTASSASQPIHELKKGTAPNLSRRHHIQKRDVDPSLLYPEHNLSVPIDHFHNESMYEPHSDGTFNLRYWFDATYYKAGGPVIVLESGEDTGTDRLPYLQKGILHQLAEATNGIGVVLEHRYYGTSFPTPDLSTENLRFLTTQQALADTTYFAKNVVFEGLEDKKLTAPNTAYIAYGGSYAGAFVAFLRKTYPDVYFGEHNPISLLTL